MVHCQHPYRPLDQLSTIAHTLESACWVGLFCVRVNYSNWDHFACALPCLEQQDLQKRLNCYQLWYNQKRSHQALDGLTPEEAWDGFEPDEPIPIRSADWPSHTHIRIQRSRLKDDGHLPVIKISVTRQAA